MKKENILRIVLLLVLVSAVTIFFTLDLKQHFTLESIKAQKEALQGFYEQNIFLVLGVFGLVYVTVTALSLPLAAALTLLAGALFGFIPGVIVVSFASTIGATLAFLMARFLLRDRIQNKYGSYLKKINAGFEREGSFYLFALRLVPAFPFVLVNLITALLPIKTWTFYWVSQLGMLAGTAVYVYAGTELGRISSFSDIASPTLLLAFTLLGVFPLIARRVIGLLRREERVKNYDYNMIVIGAGSAGLVSAYIAAAVKAKVALIEKHKMGGDCLNTGCVPSKALIRSAKILSYASRAKEFGLKKASVEYSFADVMKRVRGVIKKIEPHDSVERYTGLGVECIKGEARIAGPHRVEVNGKILTARSITAATGASPLVPPIPGLDKIDYLTSDNIWNLKTLPEELVVLGGGPIGAEMAQAFSRLGSKVTIVEMAPQILIREDEEVIELLTEKFRSEGITVLTGHRAKAFSAGKLICEHEGKDVAIKFDKVLVALGRKANVSGYGLEELDVKLKENGTIDADPFMCTNIPGLYVCGDVTGPYQFTHTASHQAWYASVNALFSPFKKFRADYSVIPWATFTDPEIARVGLNEKEAREKKIACEVTRYGIDDLDRAIADSEALGFVKVLTVPGRDKILGVTITAANAGDLIAEYILAMKHNIGLNKILGTIHIYPTFSEANKFAAGNWKKAHIPGSAMKLLEKFHKWRR